MLGGIWDEQVAIAAAKALAKRKAKRCGIHQGTGG
jgi:hypothetical protein